MRRLIGCIAMMGALLSLGDARGEAAKGWIPAAFVLRSGDTMTGTLQIDFTGDEPRLKIYLPWDAVGTIGLDFSGSSGLTTDPDSWFIKLPQVGGYEQGWLGSGRLIPSDIRPPADGLFSWGTVDNRPLKIWTYNLDVLSEAVVPTPTDPDHAASVWYVDQEISILPTHIPTWTEVPTRTVTPTNTTVPTATTEPTATQTPTSTPSPDPWVNVTGDVMTGPLIMDIPTPLVTPTAYIVIGVDDTHQTSLSPCKVRHQIDWNRGDVCLIDGRNSTGIPGTSDCVYNFGDFGGFLDEEFRLDGAGNNYVLNVYPAKNHVGALGSWAGDTFYESDADRVRAQQILSLPGQIILDASFIPQAFVYFDIESAETLVMGSESPGRGGIWDWRGGCEWDIAGSANHEAIHVQRQGGSDYFIVWQDGLVDTNRTIIQELNYRDGFDWFPGYEQTNGGDDVGYYEFNLNQWWGIEPEAINLYIEMQSNATGAYIDQIDIGYRNTTDTGTSILYSQAQTIGSGDTNYNSVTIPLSNLEFPRYGWVRVYCENSPAQWIRVARIALELVLDADR